MAGQTTYVGLVKPTGPESLDIDILNTNYDKLDTELHRRGTSVNGVQADENGNYNVEEVQFARQLVATDSQQSSGEYLFRTTGGNASVATGNAELLTIQGRSVHTGQTTESLTMTVNAVERQEDPETGETPAAITAVLDHDTFVAYVPDSGTITLTYTDAWSANPSLYGVTVTNTPVAGDEIVIDYIKGSRGTITNSEPVRFASTGWNLYNHTAGYAHVKKYSDDYGFMIGGTYTAVKYSSTLTGAKVTITPSGGEFDIPGDGYIWVTGGSASDTFVMMTWSDWSEGPTGDFAAYSESSVNLSTVMTNFPYGLLQVGGVWDEIDLRSGYAVSRIERMAYIQENLEEAEASGRPYDCDTDYIYLVRGTPITYTISIDGTYAADDHGLEIVYSNTDVPVYVQTLYGQNLVDKLRTDVLTKSSDIVNALTSTATNKALSANMGKVLNDAVNGKINNYGNNASAPELNTLLVNNINANADVIAFGAGQERSKLTNNGGIMYNHGNRNYVFRSKGSNASNANEDYVLPVHSNGASNKSYDILTTKEFPFVRSIGSSPGGNSNKITFNAPASLRHALVFFGAEMLNVFCADITDSTVYSGTIPSGWTLTKSGATYTLTRATSTVFRYSILWI